MSVNNADEKTEWAELGNQTSHMLIRKLGYKPETLQNMLHARLSEDEFKWLIGDKDPRNKGPKWFFETFTEFASKSTNPVKKTIKTR